MVTPRKNLWYINLAVWVKALGDSRFPKEHECHLRARLTSLIDNTRNGLEGALDLEDASPQYRAARTRNPHCTETFALPWLGDCRTVIGIGSAYQSGRLRGAMVHALKGVVVGHEPVEGCA